MVWAAADHVEPRHRRRGDAADRRTDDRRHGVVDVADADRHSRDLRGGEGLGAPIAAIGALPAADLSAEIIQPRAGGVGSRVGILWTRMIGRLMQA